MNTVQEKTKKAKNDIIFIAVILLLVLTAGLAMFLFRVSGDTVIVTVNGQVRHEYSLHDEISIEIKNGDGSNFLVIEDGQAYISHASCPDGICSSHRPIRYDGESIICLPNKVVIEVQSREKNQPDITA